MFFLVLLLNPHHTKATYRLAESLDGQGKIAEAFTLVTSLRRIYPEVNGFVADTAVYNVYHFTDVPGIAGMKLRPQLTLL